MNNAPPEILAAIKKASALRRSLRRKMPGVCLPTLRQLTRGLTPHDMARHEAGHLIVAVVLLRAAPFFVWIGQTSAGGDGLAFVWVREKNAQNQAIFAAAGAVGQRSRGMSPFDAALFLPLLRENPHIAPRELVRRSRAYARRILQEHKAVYQSLVDALVQHKALNRPKLLRLFREHGIACGRPDRAYLRQWRAEHWPRLQGVLDRITCP